METPSASPATLKRDRWLSALLLFLPLALWPASAAFVTWRAGEMGSFYLALIGVGLAAIPAAAAGLGWASSRKLAEAFALAGITLGVLFVLRNGISLLAVPAVGYLVVYSFLSHERFRGPAAARAKPSEPSPPEHPLAWVKENVEAIAVAFIMALVIRCFCVEVFKIPSSSMEPTLLGDSAARSGDRIMVTKLTYALQDVARFEPVVFKFPGNPMKNYIKRVVGRPDELFMLYRGNVYASSGVDARPDFRIQRKSLPTQRSIWIRSWDREDRPLLQSRGYFEGHFTADRGAAPELRDGVLSGGGPGRVSWSAKRITDGHLGESRHESELVSDILFEGDVTLKSGSGRFWVRIDHDFGPFLLALNPEGGSALIRDEQSGALKTAAFPIGRAVRVEFMIFDGRACVLFDGRMQADLFFQTTLDEAEPRPVRGGLQFGADGVQFALSNLRVAQDIHYKPKLDGGGYPLSRDRPLPIQPGHYFMLGDNVNNSHDGRAWRKHTVILNTGEKVEFESQALGKHEAKEAWARRHGKDGLPRIYIEADFNGHERAIYDEEIAPDGEKPPEPFPFVEGRYIIGRAFAVCWPLSRSFRLIR
jgi:signal peptidase I